MLAGVETLREEKGFYVSKEQKKLLEEYRQENSSVEGFIVECLELKEGESVDTRKVYDVYKEFCKKDGRKHKKKSTAIKEIRAFAERNQTFSFIERLNGHDISKFEGVIINKEWENHAMSLSDF
jgi:phage/plasmid-associated DNA primase